MLGGCGPALIMCAAVGVAALAGAAADVRTVLARDFALSPQDFADLERGKTVKHTLKGVPGEIAVVGAIRVHAPKTKLIERVRDVATFKRGPDILQIGVFSSPPVEADLAPLTVDANDFDVASCRVHDCDVRLPADAIERAAAVSARGGDRQAAGGAFLKQLIFEQVAAYTSGHPGRFTQFDDDDDDRPVRPLDAFADLMSRARALDDLVPGLSDHLRRFPAGTVVGAQDVLYWSKEKFGIDPFITVTHMTIVCPSDALCVVASKDVYSTRYIDASLSLTIAIDAPASRDAFDLIYANRTRAHALGGFLSGLRRSIAERRARNGLDERLKTTRAMLER